MNKSRSVKRLILCLSEHTFISKDFFFSSIPRLGSFLEHFICPIRNKTNNSGETFTPLTLNKIIVTSVTPTSLSIGDCGRREMSRSDGE